MLQPQASIDSIPIYASPAELNDPTQQQTANPDLTILTQLQLKDLERQRAHEEFGVAFDSSTESDSSTGSPPQSNNEAISPIVTPSGLGLGIQANPLPAIPNPKVKKSDLSIRSNFLCDESISSKSRYDRLSRDSPTQVAFSFRPGDEDVLAQKSGVGDRPRRMPERRSYQRSSMETSEQHSQSSSVTRDNASDTSRRSQAALTKHSAGPNMPSRTSSSRSRPLETQEFDFMKRDDSRGSVVTALRDNSGRSSVASSQNNSLSRRGLQRNTSSNEAVTAAARALTADAKKRSEQKGSGSGSGERGSREKSSYGDVTAEDRR